MSRLVLIMVAFVAFLMSCSPQRGAEKEAEKERILTLDMREDVSGQWGSCLTDEAPAERLATNWVGRYDEVFNDSNYVHWMAAEKIGIEPLTDVRSHWHLRRPLVRISSCEDFYLEELTYSKPYLVPEAADMVHEIGRRFRDSLQARGGGDYRIRVTSVLRTAENVKRLRRRNRNAIDSSVHQLGTTIDISYNSFAADSRRVGRSASDLKALLAEVLLAMRDEGKCLVKYEKKQPCFHISAIKPAD